MDACVLTDVTFLFLQESFSNVNAWLENLQHHGDMVQTVIVGNKCDLEKTVDDMVSVLKLLLCTIS